MTSNRRVLIISGDPSGDKHCKKLIVALKKSSDIKITVVGGKVSAEVADYMEENIVDKAAVGFTEVVKLIPFFFKLKKRLIKKYIHKDSEDRVDAVIVIDYPGFNVNFIKSITKYEIPVYYYITPQVWAWGKKRIPLLSKLCKKLYCMYEFEADIFNDAGGNSKFVGHPVLEDIEIPDMKISESNIENNLENKKVALLPGSRLNEINNHLPVMIEAVKGLNCNIVIAKSPDIDENIYKNYIHEKAELTDDYYGLLNSSDFAIVSSGTATIEAAYIGIPFIAVYKVSKLSYFLANILIDSEFKNKGFIAMPNILQNKMIIPEYVQNEFTSSNLRNEIMRFISDDLLLAEISENLKMVRSKMGDGNTSGIVAEEIISELGEVK